MKLSDIKPDEIETVEKPKAKASGLRLSDLDKHEVGSVSKPSAPTAEQSSGIDEGKIEAALRGAGQGITLGFADELTGAAQGSVLGGLKTALGQDPDADTIAYQKERDASRLLNKQAKEAHPYIYGGSELLGGLAIPIPGGALVEGAGMGAKIAHGIKAGTKLGAAAGLGTSEAESPSGVALDTLVGAGTGGLVGGILPPALQQVGQNAKAATAGAVLGGGAGYVTAPEDEKLQGTLAGALAGLGLGTLAGKTAGTIYEKGLSKIPLIEEPLQQFRVNARGADTLTEPGREAIRNEATRAVTEPAEMASNFIREGQLNPANQKLANLSQGLADKINKGIDTEQEQIIAKQLSGAQSSLEQIAQLGGEAGQVVGAIKNHIASSPDTTTAVHEGYQALENYIKGNATLRNNESAQKALQEYASWITTPGDTLNVVNKQVTKMGSEVPQVTKTLKIQGEGQVTPEQLEARLSQYPELQRMGAETQRTTNDVGDITQLVNTSRQQAVQPPQIKTQASGQEVVDVLGGLSDLSQRPDIRGTTLEKGIQQSRDIVQKSGKSALLSPEQMVADEAARSQYSAFKGLADEYGIDPKSLNSEALLQQVQKIAQIPDTASRAAASQKFLGLVEKLSPDLRKNLEGSLVKLEQQRVALPSEVAPQQVAGVLNDMAPGAVEKGAAPQAILKRQQFTETAGKYIPEQELNQVFTEAAEQGKIREESLAALKNLDVNNLLSALQNSSGDNIGPKYKLEQFYKAVEKADPQMAADLRVKHAAQLDALEASYNLGGNRNELVGVMRNVLNVTAANIGRVANQVKAPFEAASKAAREAAASAVAKLTKGTPQEIEAMGAAALQKGYNRLGQYLNKAASGDMTGRAATLYMITQDKDMKQQLDELHQGN